ncbi:hypothetical protein RFI_25589 [Reticulomyxa filosa]|uniref:Uncharacterized protein n=1 Tax=Reticulomyxa filosa TaxID=46433 RepID=X6MED3_RETFI|nr:hypothetical protein RFI_25589 [Reticulomyxa filosa]|eukprot:ETO11787.1 hypothetical protein RFI_25589 [Reticulomyxa filosa]
MRTTNSIIKLVSFAFFKRRQSLIIQRLKQNQKPDAGFSFFELFLSYSAKKKLHIFPESNKGKRKAITFFKVFNIIYLYQVFTNYRKWSYVYFYSKKIRVSLKTSIKIGVEKINLHYIFLSKDYNPNNNSSYLIGCLDQIRNFFVFQKKKAQIWEGKKSGEYYAIH